MKAIGRFFKNIPGGVYLLILIVGGFCLFGKFYSDRQDAARVKDDAIIRGMFGGQFELKKFNVYDSKGQWLHGSFFFGIGSIDGGTTDDHMVSFCWKDRNNEFIVTKIKVEDIKVKVEPGLTKPYVTFIGHFDPDYFPDVIDTLNLNASFQEFMTMIVVHCNEQDFQTDVNINSLK